MKNMNNTKITNYTEIKTHEDAEGNITSTTIERTNKIQRSTEPDYIKIYTNMWCEFNQIALRLRPLFVELACRMTYADSSSPLTSQTVYTGKPISTEIQKRLEIKESTYNQYLRELTECDAIKRVGRGLYQINPQYAAKGQWKYNPNLKSGGVEDLIATFNFKDKTVETEIIWADDENSTSELDLNYRQAGLSNSIIKTQNIN